MLPVWWISVYWNDLTAPPRKAPSWAAQTPQSESDSLSSSSDPSVLRPSAVTTRFPVAAWHSTFQLSSSPCRKVSRLCAATYCTKWVMHRCHCILQCNRCHLLCFAINLICIWNQESAQSIRWSLINLLSDTKSHFKSSHMNLMPGMFLAPQPLLR